MKSLFSAALFAAISLSCAAHKSPSAPMAQPGNYQDYKAASMAPTTAQRPAPLEVSLFDKNPNGQLTEDSIQKILSAPIELEIPARVGVLPIITASDWRGPSPNYSTPPAASHSLAQSLESSEPFTLVTEMMPIPSGAVGMESLREAAARYRLRYLILYREVVQKTDRAAKATIAPKKGKGLFSKERLLEANGYAEASLFDVKTGILLFTVRTPISGDYQGEAKFIEEKLDDIAALAAEESVAMLSGEIIDEVHRYEDAVETENNTRVAQNDLTKAK